MLADLSHNLADISRCQRVKLLESFDVDCNGGERCSLSAALIIVHLELVWRSLLAALHAFASISVPSVLTYQVSLHQLAVTVNASHEKKRAADGTYLLPVRVSSYKSMRREPLQNLVLGTLLSWYRALLATAWFHDRSVPRVHREILVISCNQIVGPWSSGIINFVRTSTSKLSYIWVLKKSSR